MIGSGAVLFCPFFFNEIFQSRNDNNDKQIINVARLNLGRVFKKRLLIECSSDRKKRKITNRMEEKNGHHFAVFRRQEEHIKRILLRIYSRFVAMIFFFVVHCVKLLRGRTSFAIITGLESNRRSKSFNRHILLSNTFFFNDISAIFYTILFKHKNVPSKNNIQE